jgi:hypothetical protein
MVRAQILRNVFGIIYLGAVVASFFLPTPVFFTIGNFPKYFLPVWACYFSIFALGMRDLQLGSILVVGAHVLCIVFVGKTISVLGRKLEQKSPFAPPNPRQK